MCTLLGIAKVGSQTPPWSLQTRCPFPRDAPEPSQSQLWSSQGPPRTPLGAPKGAKGPLKCVRTTIKKRGKYVYLAFKNQPKTVFYDFRSFSGGPRTHPGPHPHRPDPPHGAQKRSQALPRTSLGETWALQSTPVNFNLATVLLKVDDCLILHRFPMILINFQIQ